MSRTWLALGDRSILDAETLRAPSRIRSLAPLPNGDFATGHQDGSICIWDTAERCVRQTIGPLDSAVTVMALLAGGQLAIGTHGGVLHLWETAGFTELARLTVSQAQLVTLAARDDNLVAIGDSDGVVYRWDMISEECPHALTTTAVEDVDDDGRTVQHAVTALLMLPRDRIAVACGRGVLRIVELSTARVDAASEWTHDTVVGLACLDGRQLVAADQDGKLRFWQGLSLTAVGRIEDLGETALAFASLPGGRFAVGLESGVAAFVPASSLQPCVRLRRHLGPIRHMCVLSDGRLVSASAEIVNIWTADGPALVERVAERGPAVVTLAGLSDGRVASLTSDGAISLWSPPDGEGGPATERLVGRHCRIGATSLAVSSDDVLLSGTPDGVVHVWQPDEPARARRLPVAGSAIRALVMPEDHAVAAATEDHGIQVWRIDEPEPLFALTCESDPCALALMGDGSLAAGYEDGVVRVWDLRHRRVKHSLTAARNAWPLPVGLPHHALAIAELTEIALWHPASRKRLTTLRGHEAGILALAALDEGWLASASRDRTIRVWNVMTGRCIAHDLDDSPCALLYLGHGRLVAGDDGGRLHWLLLRRAD